MWWLDSSRAVGNNRNYHSNMAEHSEVVVIGAGLAGLNAALTISQAGRQVLLLEVADRVGGRVATDAVDGFLLDRGFQILNPAYPELQRLGILHELDLRPFDPGVMVATDRGISRLADPIRKPQWLLSSALADIGDPATKLKLVAALARATRRGNLESPAARSGSVAESLLADGVPVDAYERLLKPFLTGVFLELPENVAAGYGDFVLKSFLHGIPAVPARGMGALPAAIADRLPSGVIRTGVRVESVTAGRVVTNAGEITADQIVVAVNPNQARDWFPQMQVAPTRACTTWYFSTETAPTKNKAILVDGLHRGPLVNTAAMSVVAPGYASRGRTLVSATALGELPGMENEQLVRKQLSQMWAVGTGDWQLVRTDVVSEALPVVPVGGSLSQPQAISKGLWLAGDHRQTPSQQGALVSGRHVAQAVLHELH